MKTSKEDTGLSTVPVASVKDTWAVISAVFLPIISAGVIIRRPRILKLAERRDAIREAVECVKRMKQKYGSGPLLLRIPGRHHALILSSEHVREVLEGTPEPFAPNTWEKESALAHFQPNGVLISDGAEREKRRTFNEEVLESNLPVHHLAQSFLRVVASESQELFETISSRDLDWDAFEGIWFSVVRRVIFGDRARDDQELREIIDRLRARANWGPLHPGGAGLRERLHNKIKMYLDRPEKGSLTEVIATSGLNQDVSPEDQICHWMFAFDPAGMALFRTLALLSTHPDQEMKAREELVERTGEDRTYLPYLRACVLESLRLWPTTPVILRETTQDTKWDNAFLPKGVSLCIFAPYFHRDDRQLDEANRFSPDLWSASRPEDRLPLVPFSGGTGVCPARHLVLLVTSAMLAALLEGKHYHLRAPVRIDPVESLPHTLNHFTLRFKVTSPPGL